MHAPDVSVPSSQEEIDDFARSVLGMKLGGSSAAGIRPGLTGCGKCVLPWVCEGVSVTKNAQNVRCVSGRAFSSTVCAVFIWVEVSRTVSVCAVQISRS